MKMIKIDMLTDKNEGELNVQLDQSIEYKQTKIYQVEEGKTKADIENDWKRLQLPITLKRSSELSVSRWLPHI